MAQLRRGRSFCRNGHSLEALGTSRDNGWACDGRKLKDGCRSGCTGFKQTKGWNRWRCQQDDWDFCEGCVTHYETAAIDTVCYCPNGHMLEALGTSRDNGWACDGMNLKDGCRGGCTGFKQTKGWNRWRCTQEDWDFCDGCVTHYRMVDLAMATLNIGDKSENVVCPNGHTMESLRKSRDNGWACDGRSLKDRCLGGCTDFKQTKGWNRWRCQQDDFDFCEGCATHYEPSDLNTSYFCPNGHKLINQTARATGWTCDGMKLKDGCVRGCTGSDQTKGWKRWRCQTDDFDFCEGCADHYKAVDKAMAALNVMKYTVCHCPKGHTLNALATSRDDGWACDGRNYPDGCLSGCTGFKQTKGWNRWRCNQDDFDFCAKCVMV